MDTDIDAILRNHPQPPKPGTRMRVVSPPASSVWHLKGGEGKLLSVEPLPEEEGGTFYNVRLDNGAVIDWHRDCFEVLG